MFLQILKFSDGKGKWMKIYSICLLLSLVYRIVRANENTSSQEINMHENPHTGIAGAIQIRTHTETAIVKTFNKFFNNYTTSAQYYTKSMIYMCDKRCMHQDAHEYGLSSAFLLSVLSERRFAILPTRKFDFYEERNYKWKLNMSEILNRPGGMILSPSTNQIRGVTDLHLLEKKLHKMDFDKKFKKDLMTMSGNHNWISDLRRHRRTYEKMPWLFKMHACDVNRLVYMGLFKVPQYVKNIIHKELLDKVGNNRLICFNRKVNESIKTNEVLDFVLANYHYSGYKIYISNMDSKDLFDNRYDTEKRMKENIVHIEFDRLYKQVKEEKKQTREDFKKIQNMADVYTLSICDVLITTESPIGILAAHLRRNSDGLFCYRSGIIFPCRRELIAGSFRDQENVPVKLDQKYYMLKRKN